VLPAYLRRTDTIEELIPWLYLKGISTSDFGEALQALVGEKAKGDLHEIWQAETKADAETAFDHFLEKYDAKYQKACECRASLAMMFKLAQSASIKWRRLRSYEKISLTQLRKDLTRHRRAFLPRRYHAGSPA
jgi:transposase-like protein